MATIARHAAAGRAGSNGLPSSVADIGRLLRRSRTRQGIRLEEVALHTGLDITQLEALETGAVAHIPDRVVILKTLRQYAEALGLPGDRLVLSLVELWPFPGPSDPALAIPEASRAGARAGAGLAEGGVGTETLVVAAPDRKNLYGDFDTAAVPRIYVENDPTASNPLGPPPIAGAYLDTGAHPAVGRPGRSPSRRPSRAPRALRVLVGLVALAVILGLIGLVLYALEPSWFHKIGIGQSTTTATSTPPTTAPNQHRPAGSGGSPPTTSAHRPAGHSGGSPSTSALSVTDSGSGTATVSVRGTNPTIRIGANGGPCWVTVTASGQTNPEFAAIINPGGQQSFPMGQSLTVQLGSGAGQATVLQGSKVLGTYTPATAPITVTFQPA